MLVEHFVHSSRETRRVHEVLEEGWRHFNIAQTLVVASVFRLAGVLLLSCRWGVPLTVP